MLSTLLLAATLTTSMQEARLKAAVDIFLPTVRTCGPALLHHWGLPNTHKALRFAVSELPHGQRGTTAGTPLNGEQIVLFPPFFELTPEHAALVLVHEWLHTQGLGETDTRAKAVRGDNGLAPTDREINASVLQHCGGGK